MTYVSVFFSIFAAFLVSTLLCPVMIYVLKFFNVNQQIRADGPRGHLRSEERRVGKECRYGWACNTDKCGYNKYF